LALSVKRRAGTGRDYIGWQEDPSDLPSWHTIIPHFSPEDEDRPLLQNVGFYKPVHTAAKSKRTSS
jgi:hypothetical protein